MYLSAAFLLLSLLGAATLLALHCSETGDEDLLATFRSFYGRNTSRVVQTLPENYAPVAWYVCSRL